MFGDPEKPASGVIEARTPLATLPERANTPDRCAASAPKTSRFPSLTPTPDDHPRAGRRSRRPAPPRAPVPPLTVSPPREHAIDPSEAAPLHPVQIDPSMSTEEPIAGTEIASALGGTPIAVEEELELEPPPFNDDGTTTDPVAFREWVSSS